MSKLCDTKAGPEGVCTITLNSPQRHNALHSDLLAELLEAVQAAQSCATNRILVLAANGPSFCSGADLETLVAEARQTATDYPYLQSLAPLLRLIHQSGQLTLAKVQGPAYGAGMGLILCCDMALGRATSCFRFPETHLGLVPAIVAPYVVAALGVRTARYLFLTGKTLSASEASACGLLQALAPPAELEALSRQTIAALLQKSAPALAQTKAMLRGLQPVPPDTQETLRWLTRHLAESDEFSARASRFLQNTVTKDRV